MNNCVGMLAAMDIGPKKKDVLTMGLSSDRNGNLCIIVDLDKQDV